MSFPCILATNLPTQNGREPTGFVKLRNIYFFSTLLLREPPPLLLETLRTLVDREVAELRDEEDEDEDEDEDSLKLE